MLFLVEGNVTHNRYMGRSTTKPVIRLVEADDGFEACTKFEQHYNDKSIPNDDSYSASAIECTSVIE